MFSHRTDWKLSLNRFTQAQVYKLTSALAGSVRVADMAVNAGNQLNYLMPAMSVTTLVLTTMPGDYNADGKVDPADYVVWRKALGRGTSLANGDDTPGVGQDDYARWRTHFGQSAAGLGSASDVPEASGILLVLIGLVQLQLGRKLWR